MKVTPRRDRPSARCDSGAWRRPALVVGSSSSESAPPRPLGILAAHLQPDGPVICCSHTTIAPSPNRWCTPSPAVR